MRARLSPLAIVLATTFAAGCGGSSQPAASAGYSPNKFTFRSDGTPNLGGLTVHLGNAAGDATLGDTVVYLTVESLKKWGANADLQNGAGNTTQLAVVSGQLQATAGPLATDLSAGLDIFGNNQVHVDYLMVSSTVTDLKSIKGKTVAIATAVSPDQFLLDGALAKAGLTRNDVKVQLTGSNGNSVNQLIQKKVDIAFVHADALKALQKQLTVNILGNSATVEPWDADTYLTATSEWLKANPGTAEAIDLAWLRAANIFDARRADWVQAAQAYTKNAVTADEASSGYDALQKAQPWPVDGSGMTKGTLQKNFDAAKQSNQIKGQGDRPVSDWADLAPWTAALSYFQKHTKAIES